MKRHIRSLADNSKKSQFSRWWMVIIPTLFFISSFVLSSLFLIRFLCFLLKFHPPTQFGSFCWLNCYVSILISSLTSILQYHINQNGEIIKFTWSKQIRKPRIHFCGVNDFWLVGDIDGDFFQNVLWCYERLMLARNCRRSSLWLWLFRGLEFQEKLSFSITNSNNDWQKRGHHH